MRETEEKSVNKKQKKEKNEMLLYPFAIIYLLTTWNKRTYAHTRRRCIVCRRLNVKSNLPDINTMRNEKL